MSNAALEGYDLRTEFGMMDVPVAQAGATWVPPQEVGIYGILANGDIATITFYFEGYWADAGAIVGTGIDLSGSTGLWGSMWSGARTALDNAYGKALSAAGQVFRGRPPGQSFSACVDQNVNQTTFGLARNSTKVFATGLAGTVLTGVGSTSGGLSLAEDLLLTGASAVPGISLSSALTTAELGSQAVAAGGGAAIGLFVGSVANCASQGVVP